MDGPPDEPDFLRYSRHLALKEFGQEAQAKLETSRVLVVGLGGLGSPAALYLAAAGCGELVLSDFDDVDVSNLQRQLLYGTGDVGKQKTVAAHARLTEINPEVDLTLVDHRMDAEELAELASDCELVIDGSDNFGTRFAVNEACVGSKTPLVSGAAIRFEGQVAVFRADLGDGPCYRCLYDETGEDLEDCRGNGVLAPLVGVIGSMLAVEAIKVLTGIGESAHGKLTLYNALTSEWRSLELHRDPECPVCGRDTGGHGATD